MCTALPLLLPDQPPPALGAARVPGVAGPVVAGAALPALKHPRLQHEEVTDMYQCSDHSPGRGR